MQELKKYIITSFPDINIVEIIVNNFKFRKKTLILHLHYEYFGEMAEWSKAHAWKVCIRQKRIMGSNPILSAIIMYCIRYNAVTAYNGEVQQYIPKYNHNKI